MSKSKGKMRSAPTGKKRRNIGAERKARKNVAKNSVIIFWITAIILICLFVGRWGIAIAKGYYGSFVCLDYGAAQAVSNMKGRAPGAEEGEELLPLQKEWDLFTSSRLRDEVTVTADDGSELHGYLHNEGAAVTVVVLPQFYDDGTADFLPGVSLHELTGCNILLIEPRMHGGSGGDYFTYGITEQYDIPVWLSWAEETLGQQSFILWGTGTGANTALMAAVHGLLPDSVAFIAAESPYASLHEMAAASIAKWYTVPAFPFLPAIEWKISASQDRFEVKDVDMPAIFAAEDAETPTVPVLFLTSEYDTYIRPEWSQAVIEAWTGTSESITGGGSHGTVYAVEQESVDAALARFWAAYGDDSGATAATSGGAS